MSKLNIVDLPQADDLSSTRMDRVWGGMSCETQVDLGNGLGDLRDTFNNLGMYGAGNALDDQQREVFSQGCTV